MSIKYEEFELVVNNTMGHLTVEARGPNQITVEPVPLGRDLRAELEQNKQLAEALRQLQHGYSPLPAELLAIGRLLFQMLMPAPILHAYAQAKGRRAHIEP